MSMLAEIILAVTALSLLIWRVLPVTGRFRGGEWLAWGGLIAAAAAVFLERPAMAGVLAATELYRPARAALALFALVPLRNIFSSDAIPESRRTEASIFFLLSVLCGSLLLLSQNYLITFLLLVTQGLLGIFLVGLPFRHRGEGEAQLKGFYLWLLILLLGAAAILAIAVCTRGLDYAAIRKFALASEGGPIVYVTMFLALLPLWMAAGVFPFHFWSVDRDTGAAWPVQNALATVGAGSATLACGKFAHQVLFQPGATATHPMLALLVGISFLGAVWGLLAALTQTDVKRLLAHYTHGLWPALLVVLWLPSERSLATVIFGFCVLLPALHLLFWVLRSLSEPGADSSLRGLGGLGRVKVFHGAAFLCGAACLLGVPPFAGFPWLLSGLAALFEQERFLPVAVYGLIYLLSALVVLRLFTRLFFADVERPILYDSRVQKFSLLDRALAVLVMGSTIYLGMYWDALRNPLLAAAKSFVNL